MRWTIKGAFYRSYILRLKCYIYNIIPVHADGSLPRKPSTAPTLHADGSCSICSGLVSVSFGVKDQGYG